MFVNINVAQAKIHTAREKKEISVRLKKIGFNSTKYKIEDADLASNESFTVRFTDKVLVNKINFPAESEFTIQQQMEPKKGVVCISFVRTKKDPILLPNGMKCSQIGFHEKMIDHCSLAAEYVQGNWHFPAQSSLYFDTDSKSTSTIKYIELTTSAEFGNYLYKKGDILEINGSEITLAHGDVALEKEYSCPPYDTNKSGNF